MSDLLNSLQIIQNALPTKVVLDQVLVRLLTSIDGRSLLEHFEDAAFGQASEAVQQQQRVHDQIRHKLDEQHNDKLAKKRNCQEDRSRDAASGYIIVLVRVGFCSGYGLCWIGSSFFLALVGRSHE